MIHCVALIANVLKFFFMEGLGYKPTASTKGAFMGWKGDLGGQFGWLGTWQRRNWSRQPGQIKTDLVVATSTTN